MAATVDCKICGLETEVSPGYIGNFVKCVLCRHTHTSKKERLAAGLSISQKDPIHCEKDFNEFLAEVEEEVVIKAAEAKVAKRARAARLAAKKAAQGAPDSPRLSTPPPEEIY